MIGSMREGTPASLRVALCIWLPTALALVLAVRPAEAATFRVDPARSELVLQIFKDGLAARFAHDHVVQATEFSGSITFDPAAPEATEITVEVRTGSLRVDDPSLRHKYGLTGEPSAGDLAEITKAMQAPGQLDVARFPAIRFVSTRVVHEPAGGYAVTGALTIRGVTRDVTVLARVRLQDGVLRGRTTLTFLQSSFGYPPYRALLGAIRNKDEVRLHVDLVAAP